MLKEKYKYTTITFLFFFHFFISFSPKILPSHVFSLKQNKKMDSYLSSWRRRLTLFSERAEMWSCLSVHWTYRQPDETRHRPGPAVETKANTNLWQFLTNDAGRQQRSVGWWHHILLMSRKLANLPVNFDTTISKHDEKQTSLIVYEIFQLCRCEWHGSY